MTFLLDTDVCVDLIRLRAPRLLARIRSHAVGEIGISSISFAELAFGAAKSREPEQNRAALEEFVAPLKIVPFDEAAANTYGGLRAALERQGARIGALRRAHRRPCSQHRRRRCHLQYPGVLPGRRSPRGRLEPNMTPG